MAGTFQPQGKNDDAHICQSTGPVKIIYQIHEIGLGSLTRRLPLPDGSSA